MHSICHMTTWDSWENVILRYIIRSYVYVRRRELVNWRRMRYFAIVSWVNLILTAAIILHLVPGTSTMAILNKWNIEKLSKQLHDSSKERIDLDCDFCRIIVDTIQFLTTQNATENEVANAITTLVCPYLNKSQTVHVADFICQQIIQEFKVWYI